jgi:CubicO group peptidase (beta-lactamase class C family)
MIERLQEEAPFWPPGARSGYHALTYGWLIGEVVRRVSGKSLGEFFELEIAKPLGLDFWIGLPQELQPRVACIVPYVPSPGDAASPFYQEVIANPQGVAALAVLNSGGFSPDIYDAAHQSVDSHLYYRAQNPSAGGITHARGLMRLYAALIDSNAALVDRDQVQLMNRVSTATHFDAVLQIPSRFSLGFMKSMGRRRVSIDDPESLIIGEQALGHSGVGGSLGFADPQCGLAFGYVMNRLGPGVLLNVRSQALVDAAYQSLGYHCDRHRNQWSH